ncbi:MAG: hypothetical protein KGH62_04520, partial [Candidatus Micrarchaeota archaeon]|nr:hypothetical protein [Candidatus Micrarchaeota archaeon]
FNIGDTVSTSIRTLWDDKQLLLISFIGAVIVALLLYFVFAGIFENLVSSINTMASSPNPSLYKAGFYWSLILLLGFEGTVLLIYLFFATAILNKAYYGAKMDISRAFSAAASRYIPALFLFILIGLSYVVSYLIIIFLLRVSLIFLLLLLVYIIAAIYLPIMISMAFPFVVLGKKGAIDSLQMSWSAVTGNWWRIFLTFLAIGIVYYIIILIFEMPLYAQVFASSFAAMNATNSSAAGSQLSSMLQGEFTSFTSPLFLVVSLVSFTLNAWYVIALALIYKSLSSPKNAAPASKKKQS